MDTNEHANTKVLVTGASGFIATHIVKLLLERGYLVRGTVRNLEDEKKVTPLKQLHPAAEENLELVQADLLDENSWEKAVEDCTYVLHVASPFPSIEPDDPNELIRPAVEGTLAVLKACDKAGCVKRVVMTSSASAIVGEGSEVPRDETHWTTNEDKIRIYNRSKTLAEKAAWDFVKDHPNLELSVMNPGYVMGPILHDSHCTSAEIVIRMLTFQMPMIPDLWHAATDVRDVAEAHVRAMTMPEAKGERFALGGRLISFLEISKILKKEFGPQGYWIPVRPAPYWTVWMYSFFDKGAALSLKDFGRKHNIDNTKMRTVLKIEPTDAEKSILDMAYSIIERGFVKKTAKYKGQSKETT